jgi:hypothetical protein
MRIDENKFSAGNGPKSGFPAWGKMGYPMEPK